jgi:hypothetical protein
LKARKHRKNQKARPSDCAAQLFLRIAEILLRGGIDAPNAERMLRQAFVHAALEKVRSTGVRPTQSNVASIAGITRLEVRSILRGSSRQAISRSTRLEQIIAGWRTDSLFLDRLGKPKRLQLRDQKGSFEHLAKKYGRDVTSRTLLDQLVRLKMVEKRGDQVVLLEAKPFLGQEVIAAISDLNFITSQLAGLGSQRARRSYVIRQAVVAARDLKSAAVAKRIAVERLETVLSSMNEISTDRASAKVRSNKRSHRLLVSAVVALEREENEL